MAMLCNIFPRWKWLSRLYKAIWSLNRGVTRVETVGFVIFFSLTENPQPHLNSQSIFSDTSRGFDGDAKPATSPWACRCVCLRCSRLNRFLKNKKNTNKNGPVWVSCWPVPPCAARCSSGLPPRSLSPVQLLSSNRLLTPISWQGRDVSTSDQPIRRGPEEPPLTPTAYARWRSAASTNQSAGLCEK